ncbi:MAG: hypothetical protein R3251_03895, partial [Candidatus Spechtbacterales bacterium]|nr:hypothetical protein [Candidatus Spechtbacterales bacterium]
MSKYKLVYIFTILAFVAISNPVLAMPAFSNAGLSTPGTDRTLVLPEAAENGHVISLGNAVDPGTGQVVEGYAIVRYKEGFHHRPDHAGGPGGNGGGGGNDDGGDTTKSSCYEFLARDAKWRSVESWEVSSADPSAPVAASTMLSQMSTDIAKWEDATDGSMDGSAGYDILGEGSLVNEVLVADTESPDNRNEVYFADIAEPGAIGVTIVWGVFSGPPFNRELV